MSAGETREAQKVRDVVVLTHTQPEQTSSALEEAIREAKRVGCRLAAAPEEFEKHGGSAAGLVPVDQLDDAPDLCLVLGGDGTILKALQREARSGTPVFGINFGTIGFLAAAERSDYLGALGLAFAGAFEIVSLPGLEVNGEGLALNDVTLVRRPRSRVAELAYRLGGREVGHVRCDGLVAATPVGSTGYNLANQGPILAWGVEGYVVSFIAPHTLTARPLVAAPGDVLQIRNAAGRDSVEIQLDGEHYRELESGDELEVRFRDDVGGLAQLEGANFYNRIREKFGRLAE